jgi:thiol:disulfide interchange protein DsbD
MRDTLCFSMLPHAVRRVLAIVLLATLPVLAWAQSGSLAQRLGANPAVVVTEQLRAELIAHAPQGVRSGAPLWLGLRLQHQPHWHTYWQNPGDSGLPTSLSWRLPPAVQAGDIQWPVPQRLSVGPMINHGFENTVLLSVPMRLGAVPQGQALDIQLHASWLVCQQACIPQEGDFRLTLTPGEVLNTHASAFEQAQAAQPETWRGQAQASVEGQRLTLTVHNLPSAWHGRALWAVPEQSDITQPAAPPEGRWTGANWTVSLPLSELRSTRPEQITWLLAPLANTPALSPPGWRVTTPVAGTWPAATEPTVPAALQEALKANAAASASAAPVPATATHSAWLLAVLGAFVGGLILNLMPCVFPVLAIKVLGFAQHAGDRRAHRLSGVADTLGVVGSFVALGLLLLVLRAAGDNLGWGFQLQNPWVVAALAALFTLLALNLAGLFEFGQFMPSRLATFQAKHPVVDAFLSGVLAVLVASPCTAPFMGASLGLAVSLPAAQALTIFASMGLGLALPYLLASWVPAVARALPRPGAWMLALRQALAFPMLLTVVWLVWVLGQQAGMDAAALLLVWLVTLSALLWALGLKPGLKVWIAPVLIAALLALTWQEAKFFTQSDAPVTANTTAPQTAWQAWQPELVAQARRDGRTVFVDFTAAWCVTCQVNKQTTLAKPAVLAAFQKNNTLLLRADWTRRDPLITTALAELGRSGVPVYVVYHGQQAPRVLSELIGVDEVLRALEP